eukprot:TRINITY_DN10080_c1_g3_i5.p2 TRINITY_DN10080_c1_g3~~TRINITY_DN10080_c1_g3_i5.p2  ORF type:complete len:131 (-),score=1.10 TRINITY_DN10080_c1_g3_i5:153-545(-)
METYFLGLVLVVLIFFLFQKDFVFFSRYVFRNQILGLLSLRFFVRVFLEIQNLNNDQFQIKQKKYKLNFDELLYIIFCKNLLKLQAIISIKSEINYQQQYQKQLNNYYQSSFYLFSFVFFQYKRILILQI